jgi:hypothetical protein
MSGCASSKNAPTNDAEDRDQIGQPVPFLSSDRDQIPHAEKLTELSKVNKKIMGNRKA